MKILERVPRFARTLPKKLIGKHARGLGVDVVEENLLLAISEKRITQKESGGSDES